MNDKIKNSFLLLISPHNNNVILIITMHNLNMCSLPPQNEMNQNCNDEKQN